MSIDAFLDELRERASDTLRGLLRDAYERGYREALAGIPVPPGGGDARLGALQGEGGGAASAPTVVWDAAVPASAREGIPPTEPSDGGATGAVEWDDGGEESVLPDVAEAAQIVRPIMPHATIATLRKRIVHMFDLERFDVDVVICRRGDRDRRQLKGSARLALYRREDP